MGRQFVRVMFLFALVVSVSATGCKRKQSTGLNPKGGQDPLSLTPLDSEWGPLSMGGDRFGMGTPVAEQFASVFFAYDNYQINPSETPKIEQVAAFMQQNADVKLVAEGHCDERGSRDYNMALGENRAQSVRAYLVSLGISGDRMQTASQGAERPVDPGHTESAWSQNRRVEFHLFR